MKPLFQFLIGLLCLGCGINGIVFLTSAFLSHRARELPTSIILVALGFLFFALGVSLFTAVFL